MAYCKLAAGGLIVFILLHTPLVVAQTGSVCSDTSGKYTANNTYRENMQSLATSLPYSASKSPNLFGASQSGAIPDAIYALALCRGDTTDASSCAVCVAAAIRNAQDRCPLVKEVIVYDDPQLPDPHLPQRHPDAKLQARKDTV